MGFVCMNVLSNLSHSTKHTWDRLSEVDVDGWNIFNARYLHIYIHNMYTTTRTNFYVIICNLFEIYREMLRRCRHFKWLHTERSSVELHKKTIKFAVNMTFKCILCCVYIYIHHYITYTIWTNLLYRPYRRRMKLYFIQNNLIISLITIRIRFWFRGLVAKH